MHVIAYKGLYFDGKIWIPDKKKAMKFETSGLAWKYVDKKFKDDEAEDIYLAKT